MLSLPLRALAIGLAASILATCATRPVEAPTPVDGAVEPAPHAILKPAATPQAFAAVEAWSGAALMPGVSAFRQSCDRAAFMAPDTLLSERAPWAGTAGDWLPACAALDVTTDEASARAVFEALLVPVEVLDPAGESRFTGYFEPVIEARRLPQGALSAPVPGPPRDLEQGPDGPLQRLPDGTTRPYPPRGEIVPEPARVLGYAHPADVFFLQIQGSGRLVFEDGLTIRAAYHAHNGQPFRSVANWLIETGRITRGAASMQGIRAWMDRAGPEETRKAIGQNPRYVFFQARPVSDPARGPEGASGLALTPLGSMAIDPQRHAFGVPYLVETEAPGLGGAWSGVLVSQDTGGAIKGAVRGDIFFGTGNAAGDAAGTMNAPGRMWALLPRAVAERLEPVPVAQLGGNRTAP